MSEIQQPKKEKRKMVDVNISNGTLVYGKKQRQFSVLDGTITCFDDITVSHEDIATFTENVNGAKYMHIVENSAALRVTALIATKPTIKSITNSLHRSINKAFKTNNVDKLRLFSGLDVPHSLDGIRTQIKLAQKYLLQLTNIPEANADLTDIPYVISSKSECTISN